MRRTRDNSKKRACPPSFLAAFLAGRCRLESGGALAVPARCWDDPSMRDITVGVVAPAYVNVPLWVAQRRGFLERRGLRATERVLGTTHGVTSALRDGAVDIALTAPEGSIADAAAGGPLRVAASLIDRPPLSMIAIPAHRAFGDLRGGRIGTSSLTEGTRHIAEAMLAAHGLTYPDDYDFALEGSHVERWKALQAGTIDAALQMIPYDEIATDAGFTNLGPVTGEFTLNAACVNHDSSEREVVTPFLQALAEATEWFRGNIEESAAIAAGRTAIEPRYALHACRALAAGGVIPPDLRPGPAALAAVVRALQRSALLAEEDQDPAAALDWSYLG
jgi:NitT/TauT family transport system substrate-binding protein